jgi:hypothetical protein
MSGTFGSLGFRRSFGNTHQTPPVFDVLGTSPLQTFADLKGRFTVKLGNSGVTAGVYAWPTSVTVTNEGLVSAITAGTSPVYTVTAGGGITVSPTTINPVVSITNTGVVAGVYDKPILTVNARGQITTILDSIQCSANTLDFRATKSITATNADTVLTDTSLDAGYPNDNNVSSDFTWDGQTLTYNRTNDGVVAAALNLELANVTGTIPVAVKILKHSAASPIGTVVVARYGFHDVGGFTFSYLGCSCIVKMKTNDWLQFVVTNGSGSALGTATYHISATFVGS